MAKKKVTKQFTPEEERAARLDRFFSDGYGTYSSIPTYGFEIGDSVKIGNLKDVIVTDKVSNSVYEIEYNAVRLLDGKIDDGGRERRFVWWYQIRPINNNDQSFIQNNDLRLSFSQQSLNGGILHRVYFFGVDFSPEYQRDYVWSDKDKVELIDSIFNCVEIGKFVFIRNDFGENPDSYTVLDGKQRVRALLDFYENRFSYKGKFYNDLSPVDQSHFCNFEVSVAEIRSITEEQAMRYFLKLNRCGKIMDEKHLQKVEELLKKRTSN